MNALKKRDRENKNEKERYREDREDKVRKYNGIFVSMLKRNLFTNKVLFFLFQIILIYIFLFIQIEGVIT